MKNFIVYIVLVFLGLFGALYWKQSGGNARDLRPVMKVYASSSFIAQWGPGPWLKETFEKTCECKVEFHDSADSTIMIQRLKSEGRAGGADVVLGFDQYDLEAATQGIEWRKVSTEQFDFDERVRGALVRGPLIPYDWSLLAFVVRKSDFPKLQTKLDDLLNPDLRGQIALQDPRTSSPGLQFLLWLIQLRGEEKAFEFIRTLNSQLHSYTPSWSTAYGLFQKAQVKMTYSYITSPVYHLIEDKSEDVVALSFQEGHPVQFEFMGIPSTCQSCELAEKFVSLILSPEGQKVIMEKNYMLPVIQGVSNKTPFDRLDQYKITDLEVLPNLADRERILRKWAQIRRGE